MAICNCCRCKTLSHEQFSSCAHAACHWQWCCQQLAPQLAIDHSPSYCAATPQSCNVTLPNMTCGTQLLEPLLLLGSRPVQQVLLKAALAALNAERTSSCSQARLSCYLCWCCICSTEVAHAAPTAAAAAAACSAKMNRTTGSCRVAMLGVGRMAQLWGRWGSTWCSTRPVPRDCCSFLANLRKGWLVQSMSVMAVNAMLSSRNRGVFPWGS